MQNRFIRNVSANTVQLITNQFFGLAIFYALSRGLDKKQFGQINWSLAVLLTAFGILTFGIDQLMVKKIASGDNKQSIFSAYLFHVLITGFVFYSLLIACYLFYPGILAQKTFLLFIGFGKLMIFLSTPFKQLAAGLEKFSTLLRMSVVSNILRGSGLLLVLLLHKMSVMYVLLIFIGGDIAELICCIIITGPLLQQPYKVSWNKKLQWQLLKESLPQSGVVIFTAVMARFDWILIGLLISSAKLAEYSFAWKIYEVSTFPLLIIAPIMTPLFTRIFKTSQNNNPSFFLEWNIIAACFIALLLNTGWSSLVDNITNGKYGAVNASSIFILSLGMPLLYFNNYLWTINFAQGKLKLIFVIMLISFIVNIAGCCILIPLYKNEGAAFANFLTLLVQLILYLQKTSFPMQAKRRLALFVWPLSSFICWFLAYRFSSNAIAAIAVAAILYITIIYTSKQVRVRDWQTLKSLYQ